MSSKEENSFYQAALRLKEERLRLGLSQQDAADACGVSREMWGKYERGKGVPGGEVLFSFASRGADINYILTGMRVAVPAVSEGSDPLAIRKEKLKNMIDRADDPKTLDAVQNDLERDEQYREVKRELADLRREIRQGSRHAA